MIDPEIHPYAWRDLLVRIEKSLRNKDGETVISYVDEALWALQWHARIGGDSVDFLEALMVTNGLVAPTVDWYGLDTFLRRLTQTHAMKADDSAVWDVLTARKAYRNRGALYRLRVTIGQQDVLKQAETAAEERLRLRGAVARQTDSITRLAWSLFTIQTLRDCAGAPSADTFIAKLGVEIPEHRTAFLRQESFQAILKAISGMPAEVLAPGAHRLERKP